jgi:hypothetical protein
VPTTNSHVWDRVATSIPQDKARSIGGSVNRKIQIKRQIEKFVADRGFTVANSKKPDAIKDLLHHLHPVTTHFDLTRFGQPCDGGYLIPNDLEGLVACFSPGVDVKSSFEADLAARSIPCYLADASVNGPPTVNPLIHFQKKFVGVVEDDTTITLEKWVNENAPGDGDLLLQMDIEGAEWPVMLNVSDSVLMRFRIVVLELHGMERLLDPFAFDVIAATMNRLLTCFHVVHLHPNNHIPPHRGAGLTLPRDMEITLLRRDRAPATGYATAFPHPLDAACTPGRPNYALPDDWHRSSPEMAP